MATKPGVVRYQLLTQPKILLPGLRIKVIEEITYEHHDHPWNRYDENGQLAREASYEMGERALCPQLYVYWGPVVPGGS